MLYDFYEVLLKDGDAWRLLTGSSSNFCYLPKVSRSLLQLVLNPRVEGLSRIGRIACPSFLKATSSTLNRMTGLQDLSLPRPLWKYRSGRLLSSTPSPNAHRGRRRRYRRYVEWNYPLAYLTIDMVFFCSGWVVVLISFGLCSTQIVVRWVPWTMPVLVENLSTCLVWWIPKTFDLYYEMREAGGMTFFSQGCSW